MIERLDRLCVESALPELDAAAERGRSLAGLNDDITRLTVLVTAAMPNADVDERVPELTITTTDADDLATTVEIARMALDEVNQQ